MTDPQPELPTASWGRRILALFVDWFASTLVVVLVIGPDGWSDDPSSGFYTLAVFAVESAVLTALAGGSFGKLVTGLRTLRYGATGPLGLLPAFVRQVLVCLVIPPIVFRPDGRGLHDLLAGSATYPTAVLRGR